MKTPNPEPDRRSFITRFEAASSTTRMELPVILTGLMPGVKLVPAHTMALGLVQEKGCTYENV